MRNSQCAKIVHNFSACEIWVLSQSIDFTESNHDPDPRADLRRYNALILPFPAMKIAVKEKEQSGASLLGQATRKECMYH